MNRAIRVLLVDDSTFVRRFLRRVLARDPELEIVGEARTGVEALELAKRLKPDVVTLDLELPDLWGMEVLRHLRRSGDAGVVVVVSSFTREGSEIAFQALEEGAFDFIDKSQVQNRFDFARLAEEIVTKIRLAAGRHLPAPLPTPPQALRPMPREEKVPALPPAVLKGVIVVGASTGGPPAIRAFLQPFHPGIPASILVVQHMPPGFVEGFTQRLARSAPIYVHLLRETTLLVPGHAYVVPSGYEARFEREEGELRAYSVSAPEDALYRPSIDRTLLELTEVWEGPLLAVILTGMGSDAVQGARRVKEKGGIVMIQDEGSAVIFGMPRVVRERVPVDAEAPPETLGELALRWAEGLRKGEEEDKEGKPIRKEKGKE